MRNRENLLWERKGMNRWNLAVQQTDVFRTLGSANSASWDQQLTAVLAERFFERFTNDGCNEAPEVILRIPYG